MAHVLGLLHGTSELCILWQPELEKFYLLSRMEFTENKQKRRLDSFMTEREAQAPEEAKWRFISWNKKMFVTLFAVNLISPEIHTLKSQPSV